MPKKKSNRFIFFDRDGVLIKDHGYVGDPKNVELFDEVIEALKELALAGFQFAVVTNQSGVAREYFRLADVDRCHRKLDKLITPFQIAAYYVCPHHPKGTDKQFAIVCNCRKPAIGLLEQAARDLNFDPDNSFFIGDKISDVDCGMNFGMRSVQIDRGQYPIHPNPWLKTDNLLDAARLIRKDTES